MKSNSKITYIFAHGAGAPSTSDWMNTVSEMIINRSEKRINVIRFNFPYMEKRIRENKKYPPNRMPKLLEEWYRQINLIDSDQVIFIGGKSMGGRASTLLNFTELENKVRGIITYGFPFHSPGKEPGDRILHLKDLNIACLINQGERDPMGTKDEIKNYNLSKKIKINYLPDGNHDLKPRVKSGITLDQNLIRAVDCSIDFMMENLS